MKKIRNRFSIVAITLISVLIISESCSKKEPSIKFPLGTFPDTIISLEDINSVYDDYNSSLPTTQLEGEIPLIFSSNRGSRGGQYDFVAADIRYTMDQMTGDFESGSSMGTDAFITALITRANTTLNDFGPCRIFNSADGKEYFIYTSENSTGNLDLFYLKYAPELGSTIPTFPVPVKIKVLNSLSNEGYLSFNNDKLTAYFTSDRGGNWDIYSQTRAVTTKMDDWFNSDFATAVMPDSINSPSNDKCPFIYNDFMIFASDRPGGLGGYDLYYSLLKNGKWGTAVNLGPGINTASDEFRPVIGTQSDFTNVFIIFSSNRPGGKGGFDLYMTGFDIPLI